jgi:Ni,Fe-hydrogenase maturation factor
MCLIGIQPESIDTGTELSETVRAKLDVLIDKVFQRLKEWGVNVAQKKQCSL